MKRKNLNITIQFLCIMDSVKKELQNVITYAEENKLTNSQEFLNFLDDVNKLSVKY